MNPTPTMIAHLDQCTGSFSSRRQLWYITWIGKGYCNPVLVAKTTVTIFNLCTDV